MPEKWLQNACKSKENACNKSKVNKKEIKKEIKKEKENLLFSLDLESNTDDRQKVSEFVSMTNAEYSALVAKLGETDARRCIEILDNYKGANGKSYKSDYRAILSWVTDRLNKEKIEKNGKINNRGKTLTDEELIRNIRQGIDRGVAEN